MLENMRTLRAHPSVNIRIFESGAFKWIINKTKKKKNITNGNAMLKYWNRNRKVTAGWRCALASLWQTSQGDKKTAYKTRPCNRVEIVFNRNNPLSLKIALLFIVLIQHVSITFGHTNYYYYYCVREHALAVIITTGLCRGPPFHCEDNIM